MEKNMAYHDLSECTLTPDERLIEANQLADMIVDEIQAELEDNEKNVVNRFYIRESSTCSVKQLFWLRDIKDKYL